MKNWPFRIGFLVVGAIIAIAYWQFYRPAQQALEQVVVPPPASQPTGGAGHPAPAYYGTG